MAEKSVDISINASDKSKPAFDSVRKNVADTKSGLDALKGSFSALSAIAGTAGLAELLTEAVHAAREAEDSEKRLGAILKANGDTIGYTREQMEGFVGELEKVTQFDDEDIRNAEGQLAKFGNIHSEVFKQALKYSADYAALTGGTMTEAAQAIGKAFSDPIQGATMLERNLGKLTATEEAQIKAAIDAGKADEARAVIAAKLERQIGGLAEAMNTDLTQALTGAKKSWDNLLEAFGRAAPVKISVEGALRGIKEGIDILRDAIEKTNKETERSIFFKGQLAPLPPEVTGKKPPAGALGNLPPGMTVDDVKAGSKADRAKADEEERLRREKADKDAAALAAEAEKREAARFKAYVAGLEQIADIENEAAKNGPKLMAEHEKDVEEARKSLFELSDIIEESRQQQITATAETMQAWDDQIKLDAQNRRERLISVMDDLRSEREIEDQHFIEQRTALLEALANKQIALDDASRIDERMRTNHEKRITAIQDAEIKKRTGAANVYRKVDLESSSFFFDQLSGLMQTHSRTQFEIGKAAAIAGAITDTYKAATGSYAALASIPFVGPALGAAAAAAAIAIGFARVQAIKSQSFGQGSGAVGTFDASPSTGLPTDFGNSGASSAPQSAVNPAPAPAPVRHITLQIIADRMIPADWVRDALIPTINDAVGDGVVLTATSVK